MAGHIGRAIVFVSVYTRTHTHNKCYIHVCIMCFVNCMYIGKSIEGDNY